LSEEQPARAIAIARDYPSLRAALAARRHALGWSQLEADHRSGLNDGYFGKLECGDRNFGDLSLCLVLQTLGLELVVRPRDQQISLTEAPIDYALRAETLL
jgi:hypothetical protein